MLGYALKKLMYNLSLCLAAYMLIFFFSRYQRVYAGWFAGAAGMIYLLAAWIYYLKSKGTDITKLLKRKKPQEVPYYLKSPAEKRRKPRIGLNAPRHNTDDDLDETAEQAETESLSAKQGLAARAAVYLAAGIAMLVLSAI